MRHTHPPQHAGSGGWSWPLIAVVTAAALGGLLRPSLTALRRYAAAERALCENSITEYQAGIYTETPEYLAANTESAKAAAAVPWWLEWLKPLIDRRITRQLDYFRRTGQS